MTVRKIWDGFMTNPVKLFFYFIAICLVPTLGLLFTEPLDGWGKVILLLFPLGVYSLLFSLLKNPGITQLLILPLLIIHAFQIVVFYLFGEEVIAVDMFLNVLTTNANEAGELLGGLLPAIFFVILVYLPSLFIAAGAYRRRTTLPGRFRLGAALTGIVLMLGTFLLTPAAQNKNTGRFTLHEDVYPANVFYNLNYARQKWLKSSRYPETSRDFTYTAVKTDTASQREIYVLMIGETGRADNWGLYGYARNTTPLMQQDTNVVVIRDAVTQSNTTHKSVSIMLTPASAENYEVIYGQKSILTAFQEAGFSTVFLSNQSANRTFTDYFGQEADYSRYYRYSNETTNNHDDLLLDELQRMIDSTAQNLFVILHTYGSHFNYTERYPQEFSVFVPDQVGRVSRSQRDILLNAYDNTILYTDHILHRLTGILQSTGGCTAFLYSSDHGEDLMDDRNGRFLHASPNPSYFQLRIPMLMWFSPVYRENFPGRVHYALENRSQPVSTNAIFHTMLDMASVTTDYLNPARSLVGVSFQPVERMYLTDHDKPIPYQRAGLKPEDRARIEKERLAN